MSSDTLASDKNIAQWAICAPMNWWAEAIDHLLEMRGIKKTRLDEIRDTDGKPKLSHRQLLRAYQGAYGPSITALKRLLDAIGASWHDWAIACEKAQMKTLGPKHSSGESRSTERWPSTVEGNGLLNLSSPLSYQAVTR